MVMEPPYYPKGGVEHPLVHPFPQKILCEIHHALQLVVSE